MRRLTYTWNGLIPMCSKGWGYPFKMPIAVPTFIFESPPIRNPSFAPQWYTTPFWYLTPYRFGWTSRHIPLEDVSKPMRFGGEFLSRCLRNDDERHSRSQPLFTTDSGPRSLARPDRHRGRLGAPTLSTSSARTSAGLRAFNYPRYGRGHTRQDARRRRGYSPKIGRSGLCRGVRRRSSAAGHSLSS